MGDDANVFSQSEGFRSRCAAPLSQQSEKFLLEQSRTFLFETGKLAG